MNILEISRCYYEVILFALYDFYKIIYGNFHAIRKKIMSYGNERETLSSTKISYFENARKVYCLQLPSKLHYGLQKNSLILDPGKYLEYVNLKQDGRSLLS